MVARGLVLTCAHLFREGTGDISVRFASNKRHRAKLIDIDYQADLAVLTIATPQGEPATANHELDPSSNLYACGFGPLGVYRCATGKIAGQAVSDGQLSLMISDPVRSGDSGGGVFDEQGRLVAVIWGEAQGVTYASYGRPLRTFLSRVLGRKSTVVYACPGGVCPSRPANPPLPRRDTPRGVDARWADFQQQLDELRATKQDRGDYLRRSELPDLGGYVRDEELQRLENEASTRHDSLLQRIENLSGRALGPIRWQSGCRFAWAEWTSGLGDCRRCWRWRLAIGATREAKTKRRRRSPPPQVSTVINEARIPKMGSLR